MPLTAGFPSNDLKRPLASIAKLLATLAFEPPCLSKGIKRRKS